VFLLERFGWLSIHHIWRYWPIMFIAMGISRFAFPASAERVGNGVMFMLMGLAFLAINLGWWDFDWQKSWSLVLVAVGAGIVTRAVLSRFWSEESPADPTGQEPPHA
jgi:membrane protein implicated in regulation of membrane protease activity